MQRWAWQPLLGLSLVEYSRKETVILTRTSLTAHSDKVTWRWCFYINLPLGVVTFAIVTIFIDLPQDPKYKAMRGVELLKQLDFPGVLTLVPAIITLLLALQWGGSTYTWSSPRIIVLLILSGLFSAAFVAVQHFTPKTCTVPGSIFRSRSIAFTTWYAVCTFSVFVVMVYYLPIWFQGIQQVSAFQSGVRVIPLILGFIIFAIISGMLTEITGYYTPLMDGSSIIIPIAIGLLSTFRPDTPSSEWIGYQALLGFGIGLGIQCPLVVIQNILIEDEVPIGTALITLVQNLFGAVFIAIAQNVFKNQLKRNVSAVLPDLDIRILLNGGGVTTVISKVPSNLHTDFLEAYSRSVTQTYYIGIALGALSMIGSLGTEWIPIKKDGENKNEPAGDGERGQRDAKVQVSVQNNKMLVEQAEVK